MPIRRRDFLLAASAAVALPTVARAAGLRDFDPALGVCRGIGDVETVAAGGAAYLECRTGDLGVDASGEEAARIAAAFAASPIPVRAANSFLPGHLRCVGPEADHAAVLDYAARVFERAGDLGLEQIVFGSSGARRKPDDFSRDRAELQFTALLARMGDRAAGHGLTVCLEPLQPSECNWLNTVAQGARIVGATHHPNVALTADLFHMLRSSEGPESITAAGALVRHVHVAENEGRAAPGTHGEDFRPYLAALASSGYAGRISIECRWSDLEAELPRARATLAEQIAAVR